SGKLLQLPLAAFHRPSVPFSPWSQCVRIVATRPFSQAWAWRRMFNSDSGESELVETWQRFVQGLLGVLALVGALAMAYYHVPPETTGLEQQVHQLSREVADMEKQQS